MEKSLETFCGVFLVADLTLRDDHVDAEEKPHAITDDKNDQTIYRSSDEWSNKTTKHRRMQMDLLQTIGWIMKD